jgi:hypothetical protein
MSCTWDTERGFGERSWRYSAVVNDGKVLPPPSPPPSPSIDGAMRNAASIASLACGATLAAIFCQREHVACEHADMQASARPKQVRRSELCFTSASSMQRESASDPMRPWCRSRRCSSREVLSPRCVCDCVSARACVHACMYVRLVRCSPCLVSLPSLSLLPPASLLCFLLHISSCVTLH